MTPEEKAISLQRIAMDIMAEGGGQSLGMAAIDLTEGNVPEDKQMVVASVLLTDAAASMIAMAIAHLPNEVRPDAIASMGKALAEKATYRANLIREKEGMK